MTKRTGLEARLGKALVAGLVMSGLLSGCAVTPTVIRDLPELPAEFARDLAVARTAPVLMTKPTATAPTLPPGSTGPIFAIARACTAIFEGYVIYPITVCYPPTVLYEALILSAAAARPVSGKTPDIPVKYFKLSSHPLARVGLPWYCTVRGGPWYARVEGAQSCNVNPNIRQFKAELIAAPEPVVVLWSGALSDVPPPLNLLGISQTGEFCTCCSGTMCPDGRCVIDFQQCGVMPPALK